MSEPITTEKPKIRCAVCLPVPKDKAAQTPDSSERFSNFARAPEAQLQEAVGLAEAIDLEICLTDITRLFAPKPNMLYGSGKVEELGHQFKANEIYITFVDHPLTPVQQRNLERAWQTKVLDRTGMILEIFGARAQTKEGKLQVDLAALRYQRGRLVRSWTHLERQRGGGGFLGGPGETQIESDRRDLQTKIERLDKQLEQVRRTRSLHRKQRKKNDIPIVAFVGYTNAGKSTLFNCLTKAEVMAKDLLFATLDPTLRHIELPEGTHAVVSDTVGFISNLPTDLIAAFRATLEEVVEADVIVHVRDISHPDHRAQAEDVTHVLSDLGIKVADRDALQEAGTYYIEVWNKIDQLSDDARAHVEEQMDRRSGPAICMTSAVTGEGTADFLSYLENCLIGDQQHHTIVLSGDALNHMHRAYSMGTVLDRRVNEDGDVVLTLRSNRWKELSKYFKITP